MTDKSLTEQIPAGIVALALVPAHPLVWGWCLSKLWNWFVTPAPFSMQPISIPQAAGLILLLVVVSGVLGAWHKSDEREVGKIIGAVVAKWILAAILVGVGAIYHSFL